MGKVNTKVIAPQGNGSTTEWTASEGDSHNCVDAMTECYGDTKYIHISNFNEIHFFTTPDSGYSTENIRGITLFSRCKDGGSAIDHGVYLGFFISNIEYWSDPIMITSSSTYLVIKNRWAVNPHTGLNWTQSDIVNLEFGIKSAKIIGGYDGNPRCSQLQLIMWCSD